MAGTLPTSWAIWRHEGMLMGHWSLCPVAWVDFSETEHRPCLRG